MAILGRWTLKHNQQFLLHRRSKKRIKNRRKSWRNTRPDKESLPARSARSELSSRHKLWEDTWVSLIPIAAKTLPLSSKKGKIEHQKEKFCNWQRRYTAKNMVCKPSCLEISWTLSSPNLRTQWSTSKDSNLRMKRQHLAYNSDSIIIIILSPPI